uniref:Uncharacterized protein n=1 Tax=Pithovirus LCPAC304 TaxID=2506594 RepID=A0A481Z8Y5_9VIRU|nr:MAG: hypothetical protein LCPAC304_01810 [Pithovirus LCPAC304]
MIFFTHLRKYKMKDLILKSLADRCAEVLLQNLEYVDVSKLPDELTYKLLRKSCSANHNDGLIPAYTYHIKEPERSTSRREYANQIRRYLDEVEDIYGEENKTEKAYELFEYMVQEKRHFQITASTRNKGFRLVVKRKLIGFWHKHHLDRMKSYWVQLFDEPFPNKKTQKRYVLKGKSVEELSRRELIDNVDLLTEYRESVDFVVTSPSMKELQDWLREALTVFDE